jgi:hypothetical protein
MCVRRELFISRIIPIVFALSELSGEIGRLRHLKEVILSTSPAPIGFRQL